MTAPEPVQRTRRGLAWLGVGVAVAMLVAVGLWFRRNRGAPLVIGISPNARESERLVAQIAALDAQFERAPSDRSTYDARRAALKAELARALASNPKLLLLDEIAAGLTDDEGKELVALIRRIRERGVTIVWIEHVVHALLAVADRILVLNFGEKITEGAPQAVINDPEVKRVYMGIEA